MPTVFRNREFTTKLFVLSAALASLGLELMLRPTSQAQTTPEQVVLAAAPAEPKLQPAPPSPRQTFRLLVTAPEPLLSGGQITRPLIHKGFELALSAVDAQQARDGTLPRAALDKLYSQIERSPKDAFFRLSGNDWGAQGQTGWTVKRAATDAAFLAAAQQNGPDVAVSLKLIAPGRSVRVLKEAGVVAHIAAGKSSFAGSPEFRVHNIRVGSAKLSGLWLARGEVFDFNGSLGRISASSGFVPGYIISGGSLALEDGGGVCQISTTVFRAAYLAGLPIVERHAHSHQVAYYDPPGFEATVYAPSKNLRFANDTAAPLLIQASWDVEDETLRFDLFGAKLERQVSLSEGQIVGRRPASDPTYFADPSLSEGEIKRVDLPAAGMRVKIVRTVKREGEKAETDVLRSNYRPWGGAFAVPPGDQRAKR